MPLTWSWVALSIAHQTQWPNSRAFSSGADSSGNSRPWRQVSQDPVSANEIGLTVDGQKLLVNPQAQNFYAYANDNPIRNSDPSGKLVEVVAVPAASTIVGYYTYILITNTPDAARQLVGVPSSVSDPTRITLSGEPTQSGLLANFGDLHAVVNSGTDFSNNEKSSVKTSGIRTSNV